MPYEPIFPDVSADTVTVVVRTRGRLYTGSAVLGEAWDVAVGPQSLESGAMSAVREICQRICCQDGGQARLDQGRSPGDRS